MADAAVAQMVEREETSLVKGFNSNPDHLLSALSQVRILPRQKSSDFLSRELYCGKTSLVKDFHSNENWHMWVRIPPQ